MQGMIAKSICRFRRGLPLAAAMLGSILIGESGSANEQASTEQLVAEMNQRIATIMRSSPIDGVIPRFNQAKAWLSRRHVSRTRVNQ